MYESGLCRTAANLNINSAVTSVINYVYNWITGLFILDIFSRLDHSL